MAKQKKPKKRKTGYIRKNGYVMAAVAIIGGVMQADAQSQQAKAAGRQAGYNAGIDQFNAGQVLEASKKQAALIMSKSERLRKTQQVQQAASGVVIGEGSALSVTEDTENLAARDALVTMYQGAEGNAAYLQQAEMGIRAGVSTSKAYATTSNATLLSTVASAASSYTAGNSLTAKK